MNNRVKRETLRGFCLAAGLAAATLAPIGALCAADKAGSAPQRGSFLGEAPVQMVLLEGIEVRPGDKGTDLVVKASKPFMFTSYESGPRTLVVDLPGVDVGDLADVQADTPEVRSVAVMSPAEVEGGRYARLEVTKSEAGGKGAVSMDPANDRIVHVFIPRTGEPPASTPAAAEPDDLAHASGGPAAGGFDPATVLAARPAVRIGKEAEEGPKGPPATVLRDVRVGRQGDLMTLDLVTDGVVEYTSFTLDNPSRLVLDLRGVHDGVRPSSIRVGASGVDRVRIAQHQPDPNPVVRVVLDADAPLAHRLVRKTDGLVVYVSDKGEAALAGVSTEGGNGAAKPADALLASAEALGRPDDGDAAYDATWDAPKAAPDADSDSEDPLYETQQIVQPAPEIPQSLRPSFEAKVIGGEEELYTGQRISLDLREAPIVDIFRLFHEISGLNIVVDPSIGSKTITIDVDNVPWDQVLDLILKTHGLGKTFEGNVLRIAPSNKLAQEEREQEALRAARESAVPPITVTRTLSYARASDIEELINRIVRTGAGGGGGGGRGQAISIVDERTNTLILRDIPDRIKEVNDLIDQLDVPARQVMIEARIVETQKNYQQSFGIQWGFNYVASPEFGNTTDFTFPNRILVNGDALTGQGGLTNPLGGYAVNLPAPSINSGVVLSLGNILNTFQLDIALQALETKGKARIISAPRIIAQNNEPASIESGVQIPIVSTTAAEIDVRFVSASLRLEVTPQITKEDTVILNLTVENNSPSQVVNVGDVPGITTRQAQTTVLVQNGGTTVIGGIYQVNEGVSTQRTPFLHRIPLLGWLFKNKNRTTDNNELLIFITPRILN